LFEFKHSTNWRESFVSGIAETPLLDCEEYFDSLLGRHVLAGMVVGGVGFFEAPEDANDFLHCSYFIFYRDHRGVRPRIGPHDSGDMIGG